MDSAVESNTVRIYSGRDIGAPVDLDWIRRFGTRLVPSPLTLIRAIPSGEFGYPTRVRAGACQVRLLASACHRGRRKVDQRAGDCQCLALEHLRLVR